MSYQPKPATQAQFDFMSKLLTQKSITNLSEAEQDWLGRPDLWPSMNTKEASNAIQKLIECPDKAEATTVSPF